MTKANRKSQLPTPIVTDMDALQAEFETSAAELRTAELAVVHATAMRDVAVARYQNADKAFQTGFALVRTELTVARVV